MLLRSSRRVPAGVASSSSLRYSAVARTSIPRPLQRNERRSLTAEVIRAENKNLIPIRYVCIPASVLQGGEGMRADGQDELERYDLSGRLERS